MYFSDQLIKWVALNKSPTIGTAISASSILNGYKRSNVDTINVQTAHVDPKLKTLTDRLNLKPSDVDWINDKGNINDEKRGDKKEHERFGEGMVMIVMTMVSNLFRPQSQTLSESIPHSYPAPNHNNKLCIKMGTQIKLSKR